MTSATVLYLVRHGESIGNLVPGSRRSDDPPLTPRGREQAEAAAASLASSGVDAVLSSRLRRARETAAAIAAVSGLTAGVVDGFAEVDMGVLADAGTPEGRAERDAIFSAWLAGDYRRAFPGGEDFAGVMSRTSEGLHALGRRFQGMRVALVTHRMPIAAAVALCAPGKSTAPPSACRNGSITTLQADGESWRLVAWADAAHLEVLAGAPPGDS